MLRPDHSPTVPKFGDWDENDPASVKGITQIFNKVREEKQSRGGKVPMMPTETLYSNGQRGDGYDNIKAVGAFHGAEDNITVYGSIGSTIGMYT